MTTIADVPKIFKPISWKKNRSKYKVLKLLDEAEPEYLTTIEYLYVNSGIPINTLTCNLQNWVSWRYISMVYKDGVRVYLILNPGRSLLKKLATICPDAVQEWNNELQEWLNLLPETIEDWSRPALVKLIEPLQYHRPPTHPGVSIYRKGGCYWFYGGKIYLLTEPYQDYVVKPAVKRKKLGSNWTFYTKIDDIVAYVGQRAPLINHTVIEDIVQRSVRDF